jgi:hypothetical protein
LSSCAEAEVGDCEDEEAPLLEAGAVVDVVDPRLATPELAGLLEQDAETSEKLPSARMTSQRPRLVRQAGGLGSSCRSRSLMWSAPLAGVALGDHLGRAGVSNT